LRLLRLQQREARRLPPSDFILARFYSVDQARRESL
jgi:hypothetical protein